MPNSPVKVFLIGGPTAVVEYAGLRFLTDPTFDHRGGEYPLGSITLTKTGSPALGVDEIGPIDAVLLSHDQHQDNLDTAGRAFLARGQVVYTTPVGASRLGQKAVGMPSWAQVELDSPLGGKVRITSTPCRHGPAGIEPLTGDVTGFMLETTDGRSNPVYITGDTVYYEGIAEVARRFSPRLILAFAGSARTRGPFDLTMSANDVADTAHAFPNALIVPIHTEGWKHYTQTADDLAGVFASLNLSHRIRIVRPGEWFEG